jgi:DNA primase large subunit
MIYHFKGGFMTTGKQDRDFMNEIMATDLLERSIEWIQKNLSPEDVFKESDLEMWASTNGFVKEEP